MDKHHHMPKKERKFLKMIGVFALLALIVVIGIYAQKGSRLQGSLFSTPGASFYVTADLPAFACDMPQYPEGSKDCPFTTITQAVNAANDSDADTVAIYIATGVYFEGDDPVVLKNKTFLIEGGYNNTFTEKNPDAKARFNGRFKASNFAGEIKSISFIQSGATKTPMIDINNKDKKNKTVVLNDMYFYNVSGTSVIDFTSNSYTNKFIVQNSFFYNTEGLNDSVINIDGKSVSEVRNNVFHNSTAKVGIVSGENGMTVVNNLFSQSPAGNNSCIHIKYGDNILIAHNTLYNNKASKGAVWQEDDSAQYKPQIYNNIVQGSAIAFNMSKLSAENVRNNSIYLANVGGVDSAKNKTCLPNFVGNTDLTNPDYYKLGAGSTCIDAGYSHAILNLQAPTDYYGNNRTDLPDIGFNEYTFQTFQFAPLEMQAYFPQEEEEDGAVFEFQPMPMPIYPYFSDDDGSDDDADDSTDDSDSDKPDYECGEWTDVDASDDEYPVWLFLCERDIVYGYKDQTLRPEDPLARAELLAIAFRASEYKDVYDVDDNADYCFPDVNDEWFAKYFCTAEEEGFIEGYTDNLARPSQYVILAEGLKMMLGALGEDFEINSNPNIWYYDMLREADENDWLPYQLTSEAAVGPLQLSRRKAFNMLYRVMVY